MLRRFFIALTFALAGGGLLGAPVMAAPPQPASMLLAKGPGKDRGGRVLSVKLRDNSGDPFYAVKLIKDGQVKIIYIPARN